jgi:hypothetical protein
MDKPPKFHVFLCHNSEDKAAVREVRDRLKNLGLVPWMDEEELIAGARWLKLLQEQIRTTQSAAIFFGSHGMGRVQEHEIEILENFAMSKDRNFPLIPVFLNGFEEKVPLSPLLELRGWIDYSKPDSIQKLFEGIMGKSINSYLGELSSQKIDLEKRLAEVEKQIGYVISSASKETPVDLRPILNWLKGGSNLARKHCDLALKKNPDLKQELKAINKSEIDKLYKEVEGCLERVYYALMMQDESLLYEPGIPILTNDEKYHHAGTKIYWDIFNSIKRNIPRDFEISSKNKLESYLDQLAERFLME